MYPVESTKSPNPSYGIQLFSSFSEIMKVEGLSMSPHLRLCPILNALNPSHIPKSSQYLFFNIIIIFPRNVFGNNVR
jgi:hypothetical protein